MTLLLVGWPRNLPSWLQLSLKLILTPNQGSLLTFDLRKLFGKSLKSKVCMVALQWHNLTVSIMFLNGCLLTWRSTTVYNTRNAQLVIFFFWWLIILRTAEERRVVHARKEHFVLKRLRTAVRSRPEKQVPAAQWRVLPRNVSHPCPAMTLAKQNESVVIGGQYRIGRCQMRYLFLCFYKSQQRPVWDPAARKAKEVCRFVKRCYCCFSVYKSQNFIYAFCWFPTRLDVVLQLLC